MPGRRVHYDRAYQRNLVRLRAQSRPNGTDRRTGRPDAMPSVSVVLLPPGHPDTWTPGQLVVPTLKVVNRANGPNKTLLARVVYLLHKCGAPPYCVHIYRPTRGRVAVDAVPDERDPMCSHACLPFGATAFQPSSAMNISSHHHHHQQAQRGLKIAAAEDPFKLQAAWSSGNERKVPCLQSSNPEQIPLNFFAVVTSRPWSTRIAYTVKQ